MGFTLHRESVGLYRVDDDGGITLGYVLRANDTYGWGARYFDADDYTLGYPSRHAAAQSLLS